MALLSDLPCGCRLGGGTGFLGGTFDAARDVLGGVGGRGVEMMPNPGSISNSGTFPAASRSNTLSASSSAVSRCGAGGRGLLTSEGVGGLCLDGEVRGRVAVPRVGLDTNGPVPASPSAFIPAFISFPCRELGGGGFFLNMVGAGCKLDRGPLISLRRSSSASSSETS